MCARRPSPLQIDDGCSPRAGSTGGRGGLGALGVALALLVTSPATASARIGAPGIANVSGVVDINTSLGYEQASAAGTGLVLSASGLVLTNNHVIRGATTIRVVDPGSGSSFLARVVGYDVRSDVAVLQLTSAAHLATVKLGRSATAVAGVAVTAIGNAGGLGGSPAVTRGKLVALHQSIIVSDDLGGTERLTGLLQTNASLQPGDSGGPLLDASGAVIGMDTAASSGFQFQPGVSQGYAIPIDHALAVARQIEAGRSSTSVHIGATPFLGVDVQPAGDGFGPSPSGKGALVVGVVPSSPAQRAGVTNGDLIISLAGRKIDSFTAITGVILGLTPGSPVMLRWLDQAGVAHGARLRLASGPPQ